MASERLKPFFLGAFLILHTNDLHGRLQSTQDPRTGRWLGGIDRIARVIQDARDTKPDAVVAVDAGDFSEGSQFYRLDGGTEILRAIERTGYDLSLIGNHDWLNGAETLFASIARAGLARTRLLGTNFEWADTAGRPMPPPSSLVRHALTQVEGKSILWLGVGNGEKIYDDFLKPSAVTEATQALRRTIRALRENHVTFDAIALLSHNGIPYNRALAAALPEVSLIIGGHDHKVTPSPERVGPGAWIAHAGCWGRYVGRIEARFADHGRLQIVSGSLLEIDASVPPLPEITAHVDAMVRRLGADWSRPVGLEAGHAMERIGLNNEMGNWVADALRWNGGTDLAITQTAMIYGTLPAGVPLALGDFFNAHPAVYDPSSGKAWTQRVYEIRGRDLYGLLQTLLSVPVLGSLGIINVSGHEVRYGLPISVHPPLDPRETYSLTMNHGLRVALAYAGSLVGRTSPFPFQSDRDLGEEEWRVLSRYARVRQSADWRGRLLAPKAHIVPMDLAEEGDGLVLRVANMGSQAAPEMTLNLIWESAALKPVELGKTTEPMPRLEAGTETRIRVRIPSSLRGSRDLRLRVDDWTRPVAAPKWRPRARPST